ncbi:MAG: aerotolerance regulator BatC, partial [Prevotella sp.]|nr:aerotolerance regulator BatC [Prevotella sp.]
QQQNKDNKNQDKNQNEKDKQQKQDQQKDKQKQQKEQSQKEQMSKDNAEQLLNAALQAERATQQKLKKAMAQPNRRNLDKNW